MQSLSNNLRPDLLTCLMEMSLVLCLPREMHLCRHSSNVPRAAIGFKATKPIRLGHFSRGAESIAPAFKKRKRLMSKSGPSMLRFNILTWKRASRHKAAHCFNISTSKSVPTMVCFVRFDCFDFELCVAPQRRALFRHLNFQKG